MTISLPTTSADVMMPILACASCPSNDGVKSTAMPSSEPTAFCAASVVTMIRFPAAPPGAKSDGSSSLVRTPENGILFGWSSSLAMLSDMHSSAIDLILPVGGVDAELVRPVHDALARGLAFLGRKILSLVHHVPGEPGVALIVDRQLALARHRKMLVRQRFPALLVEYRGAYGHYLTSRTISSS